jgi:hypothetical protein
MSVSEQAHCLKYSAVFGSCPENGEPVVEGSACFRKHAPLSYGAPSFASYYILRMYAYKINVQKNHLIIRHLLHITVNS